MPRISLHSTYTWKFLSISHKINIHEIQYKKSLEHPQFAKFLQNNIIGNIAKTFWKTYADCTLSPSAFGEILEWE